MRVGKKGGFYCATKVGEGWCDWGARNDGVPYEKAPRAQNFASGAGSPAGRPTGRANVDWDRLGKVKALCGMANARLSAGKTAMDVIGELPSFETLLAAIETRAGSGGAKTGVEIHVDEDFPL